MFDVSRQLLRFAGLDMRIYWRVVLWFVALYVLIALPLSSFYYEADTDARLNASPPWKRSLLLTTLSVATVALIGGLCYFLLKALKVTASEELCRDVLPVGREGETLIQIRVFDSVSSIDGVRWFDFGFQVKVPGCKMYAKL